jgi:hypothetical protein
MEVASGFKRRANKGNLQGSRVWIWLNWCKAADRNAKGGDAEHKYEGSANQGFLKLRAFESRRRKMLISVTN